MKLSIIIVNYNVKYFLEHALISVRNALKNIEAEIIIVDNDSTDGSIEMIEKNFANTILIANKKNVGFSTANNQGIAIAKGEYALLLNPDTVVQHDTFDKCISFMDSHKNAGAIGVKMLDGSGNYLPESKRGFPSPWVAFCKAFGLSSLFPKSKFFAGYYLGHLSNNETNEVEVLAGAFMLIRKKVLEEVGNLDETFFMYGEDIDLSYRIIKGGYKNYYFPDTRIIHYKGESTKKGSLNYVKMFYQAMIIFTRKHFKNSSGFVFLLQGAIYFRALLSLLTGFFKSLLYPLLDSLVIYTGMILIKNFWEKNIKVDEGTIYSGTYTMVIIPTYILIWISSVYFNGGYDKPLRLARIVRGLLIGTFIIAAIYGFLDESLRFSRAMILLGFAYSTISLIILRWGLHFIKYKNFDIEGNTEKRTLIVGTVLEGERVKSLLKSSDVKLNVLGFVTSANEDPSNEIIGSLDDLEDLVSLYNIDEIIFCSADIPAATVIEWMTKLGSRIEFKMVPQDSMSIIGSHSKDLQGELYTIDIQLNIDTPAQRRNKRVLDILISIILIFLLPLLIFIVNDVIKLIRNIFQVLIAKKTWVGFSEFRPKTEKLPKIKEGVLNPALALSNKPFDEKTIHRLNMLYAKDYNIYKDLSILYKNIRLLGS